MSDIYYPQKSQLDQYANLLNEIFDVDFMELEKSTFADASQFDLTKWQRCLVNKVERSSGSHDLILCVQPAPAAEHNENCVATTTCHLQGPWSHSIISDGDIVSLQAVWDSQLNAYKVDKDDGFCVTNPDTLVSGTTVVGSLFCRRKSVLQDRFKGIDGNNKVMVIGSLVHDLLQTVLRKNLKTYEEIDGEASKLLQSPATAFALYENQLTREDTSLEVQKYVPNIVAFMLQYVEGLQPSMLLKDNFQGCISKVEDIEENLWVPQLGLKGKIDVSVQIRRRRNEIINNASNKTALPLELKTGRATFSMEHKGQLILYQMMLSALGRETNSGLLLYLREGIMREIQGRRNEHRDLIALRNDLAHYLSHQLQLPSSNVPLAQEQGKYVQPMALPEPISHHSACNSCPYATICCAFAQTDAALQLREGHPLRSVMEKVIAHLQPLDYEYFMHWCALLALEQQEAQKASYMRSLWTDTPAARQKYGRAIIDLQLCENVISEESRYVHTFESKQQGHKTEKDLTLSGFSVGEYVIVSSGKRLAIAAGWICDLTDATISISLERDLRQNYIGRCFIVDKHDSASNNSFNFTNLGQLIENIDESNALRAIVIHRSPPNYHKVLPKSVATYGAQILKELNSGQRSAALKALTTESYMLIKGLPGTGKTQTLVAIVRLLQLLGKSVLITSHTHSAVDNLLLRLLPHELPMMRLGSGRRAHPQLLACSECELIKGAHTEDELRCIYASYSIVGVTCLGAGHSIFLHRRFDYCIVDEATQVLQTTVLRPLFFSDKFVLVGDPDQLPPLIRSQEARMRGADESLFHRLDSAQATATLTLQYRMNKTITKLANSLTYDGALQCGSTEVQTANMKIQLRGAAKWVQRVLQSHVDQAVFLLDTLDCAERSQSFATAKHNRTWTNIEQKFAEQTPMEVEVEAKAKVVSAGQSTRTRISHYVNYCDAALVFHIVYVLLAADYPAERIGIIAPYRAQVELLRKLAAQHHAHHQAHTPALRFNAVEVNTIDQYQGRDKDIILYSCTRSGPATSRETERPRDAEILEDKRRLTVAITRAKLKLILIGDASCLQQYTPFRQLFAHIPSYCRLQLHDDKYEFQWQTLLQELSEVIGCSH